MSKATLIIDMPNSCIECPFCNEENNSCLAYMNFKAQTIILLAKGQKKAIWCPLKPLPKQAKCYPANQEPYWDGWNDCLDEILGEE